MGALVDEVFRGEWGRLVATLVGQFGDFDLAEAAQEASAVASERWPRDGMPPNPGAWLTTTARNRAIDRIRREATLAAKTRLLEVREAVEATMDEPEVEETSFPDERLELIFTCCHPALALEAQVALTLRALGGLTRRLDQRIVFGGELGRLRHAWHTRRASLVLSDAGGRLPTRARPDRTKVDDRAVGPVPGHRFPAEGAAGAVVAGLAPSPPQSISSLRRSGFGRLGGDGSDGTRSRDLRRDSALDSPAQKACN
jgi:DNA-directed RNA polymerase specialized sigma24 family protein